MIYALCREGRPLALSWDKGTLEEFLIRYPNFNWTLEEKFLSDIFEV